MKIKLFAFLICFALCFNLAGCKKHASSSNSASTTQSTKLPSWNECTLSSNWHGKNASKRMMNILSPNMKDSTFQDRVNFMKSRGCNTAHVFVANKADGECSGYSIYGKNFDWSVDKSFSDTMLARIKKLRQEKFAVVIWLISDDSNDWAQKIASNPSKYVNDLASLGFFDNASIVVLGLEMSEYWNQNQVKAVKNALKTKYSGKTGTHDVSGKCPFQAYGDIIFWQVNPTTNQNEIKTACKKALSYGKPVNFFESYREENRKNCETALKAGCYAVGNW